MPTPTMNTRRLYIHIKNELVHLVEQGNKSASYSDEVLKFSRRCRDAFSTFLDAKMHKEAEEMRLNAYYFAGVYEQLTGIPEHPKLSYVKWRESRVA